MPELAEVEFYRKRWHLSAIGNTVQQVLIHGGKRIFSGVDAHAMERALTGSKFADSEARAKQMLFRFRRPSTRTPTLWLGIHLGMTGNMSVADASYGPGKHDYLVLITTTGSSRRGRALVLNDPRMFGRIQFHEGDTTPLWWSSIAPAILSRQFTAQSVATFLDRRRRAPIKAVLLMQERFPGIGNWMADEILWRAAIHPSRPAGSLDAAEVQRLWRECRHVCQLALDAIAGRGDALPPDLNVNIPDTWLFNHRWQRGGRDPKTGAPLARATIGGRTTCWSPARQVLAKPRKTAR